jgi:hypothetical protein
MVCGLWLLRSSGLIPPFPNSVLLSAFGLQLSAVFACSVQLVAFSFMPCCLDAFIVAFTKT